MNFACPERSDELVSNVVRVSHIRLGNMEHDINVGTGDGHTDVGVRVRILVNRGDGLDTIRVQISIVQKQICS